MIYPKTKTVKENVLAKDGFVNISCKIKNGKLLPTLGFEECEAEIPTDVEFAQYSYVNENYAMVAGSNFYISEDGLNYRWIREYTETDFNMMDLRAKQTYGALIFGDNKFLYVDKQTARSRSVSVGIRSSILKNGRYFGIDRTNPYIIKWSGESNYLDWTESISGAGWVEVGYGLGEILNLVLYKDKAVAVREYGLTLFDAHGNPENFNVEYVDGLIPKIYKNTAWVVDGKLVFNTVEGLYYYDGNSVKRAEFYLSDDISDPVYTAVSGKKYLICGNSKTLKKLAILVVEVGENDGYLIDLQAEAIACGKKNFAYLDGTAYELKEGLYFTFTSGEFDFSSPQKKMLKEVVLDADGEVEIEVSNGVNSRILRGVSGKMRVNMRGKRFKITLKSKDKINGLCAVAEVKVEV